MSNLTLEKVAELAGVSRSTVSRVVNGQVGVRADVRRQVWQVIEQTGYQPHMAARALAGNRTGIIGLVIPHAATTLFADPYFPRLIQGITQVGNVNDLSLALFLFHSADEEIKLSNRVLTAGFLDGVIIASSHLSDPLIPQLLSYELPLVALGRQDRHPQISFVDVDNAGGAYAATRHLLQLGYGRVGHITGRLDMVAGLDRLAGYRRALADAGRPFDDALVAQGDFTESSGHGAMRLLLAAGADAVFAGSDLMAMGAWRAVREAGLDAPRDVALVGFDDLLPQSGQPWLTTIRQPVARSGMEAVDVLLDVIANGAEPPRRVILETELVVRRSCGAVAL